MTLRRWSALLLMPVLLSAGLSSRAFAYDDDTVGSLRFEYWPFAVDGNATVHGTKTDLKDDNKVFNGSNNGFIIGGERKFDNWGVDLDLFWGDRSGTNQYSSAQTVDWETEFLFVSMGGAFPIVDKDFEEEGGLKLDAIGGLRGCQTTVRLSFNPYDPTKDQSGSDDVGWVDPYAGLRLKTSIHEKWSAELYGDVGGFGIGSASELSVLVRAMLAWNVSDGFSILGGYRLFDLQTDRQEGNRQTQLDAHMAGPTVGLEARF